MATAIELDTPEGHFNLRAAGLCVEDGQILLHRAAGQDFWSPPGGRVRFGEDAAAAVRREFREETAVEVEVGRPLWVADLLFEDGGVPWHQLLFLFRVTLPPGAPLRARDRTHPGIEENGETLEFRWVPVADLPGLRLFPTFLRAGLAELPAAPIYLAHRDEDDGTGRSEP